MRRVRLPVVAGADRDDEQSVPARRPAEAVALQRREHQELQRRIVEWRNAAVDEGAVDCGSVAGMDDDLLRRKIGGRGGARPDDLCQAQRAVLRRVFPASTVVQGPRATRIQALGHDHEAGADLLAVERRVRAKLLVELPLQRLGGELGCQLSLERLWKELCQTTGLEDARADVSVELPQCVDRHATSDARRDDRSGRCAADEVEIVAEQRVVPEALFDQRFDDLQELQREDSSDAAAVEGENALGALGGIEMVLFQESHAHPPRQRFLGSRATNLVWTHTSLSMRVATPFAIARTSLSMPEMESLPVLDAALCRSFLNSKPCLIA